MFSFFLLHHYEDVSERGKRKMERSPSQSSSDGATPSPQHRAPERPPPPKSAADTAAAPTQGEANGTVRTNKDFFTMLDWQNDEAAEGLVDPHEELSGPEDNGFEDAFAQLSTNRATNGPAAASNHAESSQGDFFAANFSNENNAGTAPVQEPPVDLLGLGGSQKPNQANDVNLFDVGAPEPSNFDLLMGGGGGSQLPQKSATSTTANLLGDDEAFDPFMQSAGPAAPSSMTTKPAAPQNSSANQFSAFQQNTFDPFNSSSSAPKQQSSNTFDPFQDAFGNNTQSNNTKPSVTVTKTAAGNDDFLSFMESRPDSSSGKQDGPDLIGNWDSSNIGMSASFHSAGSNTSGSGMSGMPNMMSSSTLGAGSIPRNNSSPKLNSNQPQQPQKLDPFADLGSLGKNILDLCLLS